MKNYTKKILYLVTKLSQVLLRNFFKTNRKNKNYCITLYPAFKNKKELADQVSRVLWYIPNVNNVNVKICVNENLKDISLSSLEFPKHHRTPIFDSGKLNVEIISESSLEKQIKSSNLILLCNLEFPKPLRFIMKSWRRVRIVDPNFYLYTEAFTYPGILWYDIFTKEQRTNWQRDSLNNLTKMFKEFSNNNKTYLFGTGPSLDQAFNHNYSDGIRVICNTIVKNDELLEHIKPNILAFTDGAFHFGVSKYSETFLNDVIKVVKKYGVYIITCEGCSGLLGTQYPELKDNIIGVPAKRFGPPIMLTPNNFATRAYKYTILTRLMMPLAAGLTKKTILLGFDGRPIEKDDYFWKHNSKAQYVDSMGDVRKSHPSFFRDTDYQAHYLGHCKVLETVVNTYEKKGKKIEVFGNSFVPVLQKRIIEKQIELQI